MTEYMCGNCKEIHNLSQKARFCPNCGSSSLNLVVKEQAEPAARETIGVYTPETLPWGYIPPQPILAETKEDIADKDVGDVPRRRSKQS